MAVLAIGVLLSACGDFFTNYTVVNNTDQDLVTWASYEPCGAVNPKRDDFTISKVIGRHTTYEFDFHVGARPRCAYVATSDRRLVAADPGAAIGATIILNEPLAPYGDPIPPRGQLPSKSEWQAFRDDNPADRALTVILVGGVLAALFFGSRGLLRRYRRRRARSS